MCKDELEPNYTELISYEKYDELKTEYQQLENNYHNLNFKYEELVSYLQEFLESKDYENRIGEFYEWCKENKYF